jgi:hypothetical protein
MLNGKPLPAHLMSKDDLEAIIALEAIATATRLLSRSSAKEKRSPSPIAPISWWDLSRSALLAKGEIGIVSPELVNVINKKQS